MSPIYKWGPKQQALAWKGWGGVWLPQESFPGSVPRPALHILVLANQGREG